MTRRRKPPPDEPMTAFGWLVLATVLLELAYLLWWAGALRPLSAL